MRQLFENIISNSIKYSNPEKLPVIDISYEKRNGSHLIAFKDNGIGFNHDQQQYGNGLANMRKRAASWNDCLRIESEPGKGTSVILEMRIT